MKPPKKALAFLRWFCREDYIEEIEGDLTEVFCKQYADSPRKAKLRFTWSVIKYFRPEFIKSFKARQPDSFAMYKSYFKIGWRNLLRSKGYSFINIGGLAIGMTVVMFIGLWVYDELSFNKYHQHYHEIAQAYHCATDPETHEFGGGQSIQFPVAHTLRTQYPQHFKHVLLAWWPSDNTLAYGEDKFTRSGQFIESGALEMLSLKMLQGSYESLDNPPSIVLSKSAADAIFGAEDPMNKTLTIDNRMEVKVTGVYEDIPRNNRFADTKFFAPWSLWLTHNEWAQGREADWDNSPFNIYVQLQPGVTMDAANAAIKNLYPKNVPADFYKVIEKYQPFVQLVPMSTWHLYSEFKDGKPGGGRITYVWLFAIVGVFVLVLACINFINLSTARSERRAREVGVRKAIGSARSQLISQFLSESLMMVLLAFAVSLGLVWTCQGAFNILADKDIQLPFDNFYFWIITLSCIVTTALAAGIYPAFYLSSFRPAKVLKGILRTGGMAAVQRKSLVVVQFTVSVVLILGTLVVYQQIQFAKDLPVGYDRSNLITMKVNDPNYKGKLDVLKNELLATGMVTDMATSSSPMTGITNITGGHQWPGKDPNLDASFVICNVSGDFGRTVGWEIVAGRDFSKDISADSTEAIIINEAAAKYMGLKDPVGKVHTKTDEFGNVRWKRTIIGVVKDVVMESPYEPVRQTLFYYNPEAFMNLIMIRINPKVSPHVALPEIEKTLHKVVPTALFDYKFVDEAYAQKFSQEERIGKLAGVFAVLAIIISCLGLFGLASYVAEQRTKEIGIRKVMGASVSNLWRMLSKDFIVLVIIACVIAIPLSYYVMYGWLQQYQYHTSISIWLFVITCAGALMITLLTVSFQAVKAALMNPVKSLRSE